MPTVPAEACTAIETVKDTPKATEPKIKIEACNGAAKSTYSGETAATVTAIASVLTYNTVPVPVILSYIY